jgi:hypothetical protein
MCRVHDFVPSLCGFFESFPKGGFLHFVSSQRRIKLPKALVGQTVSVKKIGHRLFQMPNAFIDECLCQRSLCCDLTGHVGHNKGYAELAIINESPRYRQQSLGVRDDRCLGGY